MDRRIILAMIRVRHVICGVIAALLLAFQPAAAQQPDFYHDR